jgi:alkylated DNA repair dioxygenase AlkB
MGDLQESSAFPEGFAHLSDFLSLSEEADLINRFRELDFRAFDFHGYIAKRRIVEYGIEYDFSARRASATRPIPSFLDSYKSRAAEWAALHPDEIVEAVITEYSEGSPMGWHRDVPQFEVIIGISLKSSCRLRFKPYKAEGKIISATLQPRSLYVIRGIARWKYMHSIPAVKELRYSMTFRTARTRSRLLNAGDSTNARSNWDKGY